MAETRRNSCGRPLCRKMTTFETLCSRVAVVDGLCTAHAKSAGMNTPYHKRRRLEKAAPDLLAALRLYYDLHHARHAPPADAWTEAHAAARAALAKAEGG